MSKYSLVVSLIGPSTMEEAITRATECDLLMKMLRVLSMLGRTLRVEKGSEIAVLRDHGGVAHLMEGQITGCEQAGGDHRV